jgi:hypothetical protein
VAVIAMLARVSHEEALAVMFPNGACEYSTDQDQLNSALDHFEIHRVPQWKQFSTWEGIPTTSIVMVKSQDSQRVWLFHWVIFQRRAKGTWSVIDPIPPRAGTQRLTPTELSRFTGVSYSAVEPRR